ncbi:MAG TPA: hypothetical protein VHJ34_12760 [Actinomycetota bacterium]|nr:hypothetical protein [Actinomycetota bacterium]
MRTRAAAAALALVATACFGPDPNVNERGEGRPEVAVSFPDRVAASSTPTARVEVSNPGPGDIPSLVVAFALVGPGAGQTEVPDPLVGFGRRGRNPSIVEVVPEPTSVSRDAVVFTFEAAEGGGPLLPEGESTTIAFRIRAPVGPGVVANSVTVYDGTDPSRVRGARLETTVQSS